MGGVTPSEADFQAAVIEFARLTGWLVFHVSDSRKEVRRGGVSRLVGDELAKGWPDLALCHPRRGVFLVRELKSNRGRVTPEQKRWLEGLRAAGVDADVWRPRDLPAVQQTLASSTRTTRRQAA